MLKTFIQAAVMAMGLGLVLITLSGDTQRTGIYLSVASVVLFIATELIRDDDDKNGS
ncbi:hypothetical protein UFOVP226_27 [uncultured Caudovirales phage]|uniref:Uncharacterized protein n=1 Tax=uncultured Caudovirales phage TaxID=2100421 RepID=A0A6J7WQV3_9CAUD|nr:hypothetical protein UFOVP226_27 [uncultured Caudovirales phage]